MKIHKINDLDYAWVARQAGTEEYWTMYHTDRIQITQTRHGEFSVCDRSKTISIRDTLDSAKSCGLAYYQIEC